MVKSMVTPQAYNDFYKSNGTDRHIVVEGPSMTRQEFKDECDINVLMSKYEGHGTGPGNLMMHGDPAMWYADFTMLPETLMDYHAYMDRAQASFMRLSANVRREFDNDPTLFVEFASDPGNLEKMREWGLAAPAKAPDAPQKVEIVNPEAVQEAAVPPPQK